MNHEELLEFIDRTKTFMQDDYGFRAALRAVVELHEVRDVVTGWGTDTDATYQSICWHCDVNYPCPTIQAIEKELK